jgi:hypothetical protein
MGVHFRQFFSYLPRPSATALLSGQRQKKSPRFVRKRRRGKLLPDFTRAGFEGTLIKEATAMTILRSTEYKHQISISVFKDPLH